MKVCVVNPNYYRSSGVTVAIRRIFQGVAALGVEQHFVDCGYGNEADDVDWVPHDRLSRFRLMTSNPVVLLKQTLAFLRWLRRNDIRIVHVHHRRLAAWLNFWQFWGRFTLIYTGQLTYPFAWWFWLTSPKNTTAISESVAANIRRTTCAQQVTLISNPSDFPSKCPSVNVGQVQQTAICIARLEEVKGHQYLLEAWKKLTDRGHSYYLLLVGEGSLKSELQAQVRALGLEQQVVFRGYQHNVVEEIKCALFAILTSKVEGHPLAVIETASRGRGTLVTDVDGSRDCVPTQQGLPNLIAFGDVDALADALEVWFRTPALAVAEGKIFYSFLKANSSIEVVAQQYTELYQRVVAQ